MLTARQVEMIAVDMINGKEPRVKGEEADDFRKKLQKDIDLAKKNGWSIELPFELGDEE